MCPLRTPRLDLLPATTDHLRAELDNPTAFAAALGAAIPASWPPELYDADSTRFVLAALECAGTSTAAGGWGFYYMLLRPTAPSDKPLLVGAGGFKSPPDARGEVELGYAVAAEHRRRGLATETVRAMTAFAFDDPRTTIVFGQTLPSLPPSIGVMEKAGLHFAGEGADPHAPPGETVLRYQITRAEHERLLAASPADRIATCSCGQLRLHCTGDPERVSVCHCLECQRRTGSAFGVQARFPRERVRVEGTAARFVRTGDSGGHVAFSFCATCATTLFWEPDGLPGIVSVAVGAFADPAFPAPERFIYETRRHTWAAVPTTTGRGAERIAPVLPVRDVEAALAHYRRLGFVCDAYGERDAGGPIYGFAHLGGAELHLTRMPNLDAAHNTSACYLYVADVDALHERWSAARVAGRLDPPRDTPYGLREMAHIDPDGNLLRIGAPLPALPSVPR